jgi:hypothetical protein
VASRLDLLRAGLEEIEDPTPAEDRMIRAFARMLAVATQPKKKAQADDVKLTVPPKELFEAVRRDAGERVLCDPIDGRWFGRLGGVLKALPSFEKDDVERLTAWINAGGVASWPTGVPTFGHLITHLDKWTAFAREWDKRGRQTLRGKTSVGAASTAEATDFSAFGVRKLV